MSNAYALQTERPELSDQEISALLDRHNADIADEMQARLYGMRPMGEHPSIFGLPVSTDPSLPNGEVRFGDFSGDLRGGVYADVPAVTIERRVRKMLISGHLIIGLFQEGFAYGLRVTENALPADARIIASWYDRGRDILTLLIESEEFDLVSVADAPEHMTVFRRVEAASNA